jgi:hypothetical protein
MSIVSRVIGGLLGNDAKSIDTASVHDFTYHFDGHRITLVKPLGPDGRTFLTGTGANVKVGDVIVTRGKDATSPHVRYRIDSVNRIGDDWRAYGIVEQRSLSKANFVHEKRTLAWKSKSDVR